MNKTKTICIIIIFFMSFLTSFNFYKNVTVKGANIIVDDSGEQDYREIQDAINAASPGDNIYVRDGVYYERLIVNKSIRLIGSGQGFCIIDGNGKGDYVVDVQSDNVDIIGFTIRNKKIGIGIHIEGFNDSLINNNTIRDTHTGVYLKGCMNNSIYHNNFVNNTINAYDDSSNYWDHGYPSGGNYWDDYTGKDLNNNGLGDTPYNIEGDNNLDNYPIYKPMTEQPVASFNYTPINPYTTDIVEFNDTSNDTDGEIVSWLWSFGDGSTSTLQYPNHTYDNGFYVITLNVTDDLGASNETIKNITVLNHPPVADFNYTPISPNDLQDINFSDISTDLDGYIVTWEWDFGDGNTSNLSTLFHKYDDDGIYMVSLTVYDDDGGVDTISRQIEVYNVAPSAGFTFTPYEPNKNDTIMFQDISNDADGFIVSRSWDLGDGTMSNDENPEHRYSYGGTYQVTLVVVDDDGATSTFTNNVRIIEKSAPTEDYTGWIIVLIVFIIIFIALIGIVFYFTKKFG